MTVAMIVFRLLGKMNLVMVFILTLLMTHGAASLGIMIHIITKISQLLTMKTQKIFTENYTFRLGTLIEEVRTTDFSDFVHDHRDHETTMYLNGGDDYAQIYGGDDTVYGGEGSDFLTLSIEPANISDLYVHAEGLADDQTTIYYGDTIFADVFSIENFELLRSNRRKCLF